MVLQSSKKKSKKSNGKNSFQAKKEANKYQACKALAKAAKLVKSFKIQKLSRRTTTEVKDPSSEEALLNESSNQISRIKDLDHVQIGNYIYDHYLSLEEPTSEINPLFEDFAKHKRIVNEISMWKSKQTMLEDKIEAWKLKKQASLGQTGKKFGNIRKNITMGTSERTKAIFLDTLNEDSDDDDAVSNSQSEFDAEKQNHEGDKKFKRVKNTLQPAASKSTLDRETMRERLSIIKSVMNDKSSRDYADYMAPTLRKQAENMKIVKNIEMKEKMNPRKPSQHISSSDSTSFSSVAAHSASKPSPNSDISGNYHGGNSNSRSNSSGNSNSNSNSNSSDLNSNTNGKNWKEVGVHPSWAARMNAKPVKIDAFAGKKIVFGDDD